MYRFLFISFLFILSRTALAQTKPATPNHTTVKPTTPANTTVKPSTPANTTVKPNTPANTTVKPNTPANTTVKPSTPANTTVKPSTPANTTVKPSTPANTTVKPSTSTNTTVKPSTPTNTTVKPTTSNTTVKPSTPTSNTHVIDELETVYFCWLNPGIANYGNALSTTVEVKRVMLKVNDDHPLDDLSTLGEDGDILDPLPCFAPDLKIIYKKYTYVISSICAKIVKFKNKVDFVPSMEILPLDASMTEEFLQKISKIANTQFGASYRTQVVQASKPILAKIPPEDRIDTNVDLDDDNDDVDVPDYDVDFSDDYDPDLDDFDDLGD